EQREAAAATAEGTRAIATRKATAWAAYALAPLSPSRRAFSRRFGVARSVLLSAMGPAVPRLHERVEVARDLLDPLARDGGDEARVDLLLLESRAHLGER